MFESVIVVLLASVIFNCGHVAYYSEGVMEDVVRVRQAGWTAGSLPTDLPPVVGFVATNDCSEIGDLVWIAFLGGREREEFLGPYLVSDCCNEVAGDCTRMTRSRIVVEVDYSTAVRWDIVGWGPEFLDVCLIERR